MQNFVAGMPTVELPPGALVKFEAISPTSGSAVAGVTVQTITLTVDAPQIVQEEDVPGFVPLFVYGEPEG